MKDNMKAAVAAALRDDDYELSDGGVLLRRGIHGKGIYQTFINGEDQGEMGNLVPDEGLLDAVRIWVGATAKHSNFYLAPFSTNNAVASTWTGANFTANSSEWTGGTGGSGEGYNEATRQEWVGVEDGQLFTNAASMAAFTIVCSTTLSISGIGMIADDNVKGGTTGTLISAARYGSARTLYPADTFQVLYKIQLLDS